MASALGYGQQRLIRTIINNTWGSTALEEKKFSLKDILYIVQEMTVEEGKNQFDERAINTNSFRVFEYFVEHVLYRNLANYDSMILLTSDKGCITGDALLKTKEHPSGIELKKLVDKGPVQVYSYNIKKKKFELKWCDGVEYVKTVETCTIGTTDNNQRQLTGTYDHPILMKDGKYKQMNDFNPENKTQVVTTEGYKPISNISYQKKKQKVYDVVNVQDNHNFVVNDYVVSNTGKCMYIRDNTDFIVSADGDLVHPENAKSVSIMDENMKMTTAKVKKKYSRPEKDVYEVKLRSGKSICLTKEHPLYTIDGWKAVEDLKESDFIATPRKYNLKNNNIMNKGLIKILAYLIADGFMGGRKIEFSKQDEYIKDDFIRGLHEYDELLEYNYPRILSKDKQQFRENGDFEYKNNLTKYLLDIGLYDKRSADKFIPKDILMLNDELIALFLNRLYSCDGGVEIGKKSNTREINYTSKSKLLIKQLHHLFLRFGIISKISSKIRRATNSTNHKGNTYYRLSITGKENIILFYKNIGFYHLQKQKKLEKIYNEVLEIDSNTNVDVIPNGVFDDYKFRYNDKEYSSMLDKKRFQQKVIANKNVSYKEFKKIADIEENSRLKKIAESDIFWDKIISIEKLDTGTVTVYDLEVDNKNHNFCANDVIIHNSSAAIMMARRWCKLIGIRFNPKRHLAYSNSDVREKIDMLKPFEPLVADESVRFASSADWNKTDSKELRKKLAEVRTKHMLFILCFPLKIAKMEKTYLDSFVNYWVDLFARGLGAIYVKDKNPSNDAWRLKDFKNVGSYTEFTPINQIQARLKKHPNFWQIIKFPKPPKWLYKKYAEIREYNVYNDESNREMVTNEDIHKSLLLMALQDIMMNDTTLSMNRIILHIKNSYDIPITKQTVQSVLSDAKQLVTKIREEKV